MSDTELLEKAQAPAPTPDDVFETALSAPPALGPGVDRVRQILDWIGPAILLPIPAGQKKPVLDGWQNYGAEEMENPAYIARFANGVNVGVILGKPSHGLCSIDIDADELIAPFLELNPRLRTTLQTKRLKGCNFWIKLIGDYPKLKPFHHARLKNEKHKPLQIGEWRSTGGQTVIDGEADGLPYRRLVENAPIEISFSEIIWPEWIKDPPTLEMRKARLVQTAVENFGSLDTSKLENMTQLADGATRAACPACRAAGEDETGKHLLIRADGRFGCCKYPDNHEHRREIWKLAGQSKTADKLQAALADARPKIRLPGSDRLLSDFATELVHVLRGAEIYWRNGEIVTLAGGDLKPMTPQTFRCWTEQFLIGYRAKTIGENTFEFNVTMTDNEARGTLAAPQFADTLRRVRRMNHARLPVFGADGKLTLLPDGYHEPTQTLTLADVDYDLQMPLGVAVEKINDLLAEFCFADGERSKAVTVAAMAGVFANQLLPEKSLRPCFVFVANAEGAGKSLLAQICITPTLGAMPTGCKSNEDEEIRKFLTTAILEARLVVFFDNLKGKLSSPVLEAYLSAPIWTDRKLRFNESVTGENLATCFVTGNGMTVSPDMRRRSLFVELHQEAERAEDRKFKRLLDLPTLLEMRPKILAALWAMVKHWDSLGRPIPSRGHSAFPSWANIIGGIIQAAGFACPLETANVTADADSDADDMRKLVSAMAEKPMPLSFADLVTLAREHGLFENIIGNENEELGRREKSALSRLLTRYDRRMVLNFRFALDGKGHARRYRVENVHGDMVEHGVPVDKSLLYAREP